MVKFWAKMLVGNILYSKNYFLKFDGLNKRDQLLNESLSKIINKN